MLNLYRRHLPGCQKKNVSPERAKCGCPIWCDGQLNGKRCRQSLKTSDWQRALRLADRLERPNSERSDLIPCAQPGCNVHVKVGRCPRHTRTVAEAIAAYRLAHQDVAESTQRSRKRTLRQLEDFITTRKVRTVDEIDLDALHTFRATRSVGAGTWTKELGTVRHFFRFCLDNEWISRNWAQRISTPKNVKPAPREPYQPNEVARIIAACDRIGRSSYERLRARAMILLLRYTALRISDVATLERGRIRNGEIFLRTAKNGKPVRLPLPVELAAALKVLPVPRGANGPNCPYYFWSGNGSSDAVIRDAKRTLEAVFKASGVRGACSHRFRHTLATEVLELGGSFEEAADILGDTEVTVRKHYAKWSAGRQARISNLLERIWDAKRPDQATDFGTPLVH